MGFILPFITGTKEVSAYMSYGQVTRGRFLTEKGEGPYLAPSILPKTLARQETAPGIIHSSENTAKTLSEVSVI